MTEDACQCTVLHQDRLDRVEAGFPLLADLEVASEVFRLLGDPGRLKIVQALASEELCVCDLATFLGASSSAVSHQLRLLKQARLVKNRREGKVVYYRLDDGHVNALVITALDHARERRG
jgi:ArsR family transcriptional regulator, lead/cadmium/zinc/bismuth-responsive transcriptional repressor